ELRLDKPAERAKALQHSRAHRNNIARQEPRRVDQMAGVREEEVAALVGLGIALRPTGGGALLDERLEVVRHRVAVRRIAIPRFEGHHLPKFLADELRRERHAGIEPAVVADLEDQLGASNVLPKLFAFLDAYPQGLLDQDMLAG